VGKLVAVGSFCALCELCNFIAEVMKFSPIVVEKNNY
jgi:hypothetical protein